MLTENQKNELNKKTCKVMKSKESFKAEMAKRFSSSDIEKIWSEKSDKFGKTLAELFSAGMMKNRPHIFFIQTEGVSMPELIKN